MCFSEKNYILRFCSSRFRQPELGLLFNGNPLTGLEFSTKATKKHFFILNYCFFYLNLLKISYPLFPPHIQSSFIVKV